MFNCKDQEGFCANAKQTYRDHYAKVRRLVPKERLLEYRLGSGWEPLCAFLNKPVPDEPFPFLNETKEFAIFMQKVQTREIRRGLAYMTKYLVLPGVVVAGAAWYLRKML